MFQRLVFIKKSVDTNIQIISVKTPAIHDIIATCLLYFSHIYIHEEQQSTFKNITTNISTLTFIGLCILILILK